ncbi:unnamed protein product [Didymodactylos carnosus]|uniref:Uncharacterized protein n=1 Tax=Didymodactylos carnosus TaxID=1234261 RepID=A0A8S2FKL1_9BILA|nr:unnamed protein product [Didymodactylos carnosus]CAF4284925.1 unnamed protein product [Didymodactylos carnosus]
MNRSMLQQRTTESQQFQYKPLHWLVLSISYLFNFLLFIESVAYIVLGAWVLFISRISIVLLFSLPVYQREIGFGVLMVFTGSLGIIIIVIGAQTDGYLSDSNDLRTAFNNNIVTIQQASQFSGITCLSSISSTEKLILAMNGGIAMLMAFTILIGTVILRCLKNDVEYYTNGKSYIRSQ